MHPANIGRTAKAQNIKNDATISDVRVVSTTAAGQSR